jgi:hypothetical protein
MSAVVVLEQPVRQCAWCRRVADAATGVYSGDALSKLASATHGICPRCKEAMRAEIDASPVLVFAA